MLSVMAIYQQLSAEAQSANVQVLDKPRLVVEL